MFTKARAQEASRVFLIGAVMVVIGLLLFGAGALLKSNAGDGGKILMLISIFPFLLGIGALINGLSVLFTGKHTDVNYFCSRCGTYMKKVSDVGEVTMCDGCGSEMLRTQW